MAQNVLSDELHLLSFFHEIYPKMARNVISDEVNYNFVPTSTDTVMDEEKFEQLMKVIQTTQRDLKADFLPKSQN